MLRNARKANDLPELLIELELTALPTLLLERNGRILWQNTKLTSLFGSLAGERMQECSFLVPDKGAIETLQSILTSADPCEFTVTMADERGETKTLQFSTMPVADDMSLVAIFGLEASSTPALA